MADWLYRWRTVVALFIMVAAVSGALYLTGVAARNDLYQAQQTACIHLSTAISEINKRVPAADAERAALLVFLDGTYKARITAYNQTHHAYDRELARAAAQQAANVREFVVYRAVPYLPCKTIVKHP